MKVATKSPASKVTLDNKRTADYGVEFFHIYTDEKINKTHIASLNYLREVRKAWSFDYDLVVFIDDYNPTKHILSTESVLDYLESKNAKPNFWAYEGDMVSNAQLLLDNLTQAKLKKNYVKYIEQHNKYPCSLLSAAWYLTRLGLLPYEMIKSTSNADYTPPKKLINILPSDYKSVEHRAFKLIKHSNFSDSLDNIQDLFIPVDAHKKIDLF